MPRAREIRRVLGVRVAAGDADAAEDEELGEGAHPGAGDADEMDGARVGGVEEAGHDGGMIHDRAVQRLKSESAEVEQR